MFFWRKKRTYLDHAGSTPEWTSSRAARASSYRGNPGALHQEGARAKERLLEARQLLAEQLACKSGEIVFTSGGTEGNNLAILGFARAQEEARTLSKSHIIVSAIEHPSVLDTALSLRSRGVEVDVVAPDAHGRIPPEAVRALLRLETVFVSIGWANGEIGTLQPLSAIARELRTHGERTGKHIVFHTDVGQAPLYYSPQVHTLGVDLATFDAGKLGGPRGCGMLFMAQGTPIRSVFYGGSQESGLRPGTEQVSFALGFAAALAEAGVMRTREAERLKGLREHFIEDVLSRLEGTVVNGTSRAQSPNILNISIPNIENEYVTLALDKEGFAIATKSACKEGEAESHVVRALSGSGDTWRARNALRVSFGRETTRADLHRFLHALSDIVRRTYKQRVIR